MKKRIKEKNMKLNVLLGAISAIHEVINGDGTKEEKYDQIKGIEAMCDSIFTNTAWSDDEPEIAMPHKVLMGKIDLGDLSDIFGKDEDPEDEAEENDPVKEE